MDDVDNMDEVETYLDSTFWLKGVCYIFYFFVLMGIAYFNGENMNNKIPLYVFALITTLIFGFLPLLVNRECDNEYFCLGEINNDLKSYKESERLLISLQRSFWNLLITVIFFGFITNAIGSNITSNVSDVSDIRKVVTKIASPFSTIIYMTIVIIIINVISNIYIYFNCEDKENDYNIRSFILGQYNVVLMTIIGLVVYGVSKYLNP